MRLVPGQEISQDRLFDPHRDVDDVGEVGKAGGKLVANRKFGEESSPIQCLRGDRSGQLQHRLAGGPSVPPEDTENTLGAPGLTPRREWTLRQVATLVGEVALKKWDDLRVASRLVVLGQRLQHKHPRPPVVVGRRTEEAVRSLALERPADPALRHRHQSGVTQSVGERYQSVAIVRSTLPILAGPTEPGAVVAKVRPDLADVAGEAVCLKSQLIAQPPGRRHRPERQWLEGRKIRI